MKLSDKETERYARHIVLPHFGGAGQQILKSSRVLVVGVGGLGSPVVQYLAAAGVGKLVLIDDDEVALSNLQRQTIHATGDLGVPKVESARRFALALNPEIDVEVHDMRLVRENAGALISSVDMVADGSDSFATRHMVADACEENHKTLVSGALGQFDGSLTTLKPHLKNNAGNFTRVIVTSFQKMRTPTLCRPVNRQE